ncbi:acyltransferase family protein [Nocardioides acrostichi]|uniref:Acyltransferase n=1 Tax=Nocardioides acrostichi TaxID=2784339 RepID=A0A930UYV7_9ACTN|nr:acyltransferase family protein [Nocardioides acrostichi]MBF4162252.1 acyltransferase [Nocardioides acrostichi]
MTTTLEPLSATRQRDDRHRRTCPHCLAKAGAARAKPAFRPDIEGLRAIAVVLVALNHADVPGFGGGYIGVDVFFVLSGFLITGLLDDEADRTGRVSIGGFYARRVRRILPAASLVTVTTVAIAYLLGGASLGNRTAADGAWASVFLANIHFAASGVDYFNRGGFGSPLEHYWSLGVEEQFYVVWPVLMLGIAVLTRYARQHRSWLVAGVMTLICAVSLWFSVTYTHSSPTAAYFSPFTRAWELGIGALAAVTLRRRPPLTRHAPAIGAAVALAGLAAMAVAAFTFTSDTPFPSAWALVPVLGTTTVVVAGILSPGHAIARVLGSAPMRFVGLRSYGFYLWHLPFLVLPALRWQVDLPMRIALLLAAFGAATVMYVALENPVRHSRVLARRTPWALGLGAALVVTGLVVTLGVQQLNRVQYSGSQNVALADLPTAKAVRADLPAALRLSSPPADLAPPIDDIANAGSLTPDQETCDSDYGVTQATLCFLGDTSSSRTVVLWGDSHGAMWMPALSAVASQEGFRLAVFTKYGCAPLLGVEPWHPTDDRAYGECTAFKQSVVPLVQQLAPEQVILTGAFKGWAYVGPDGDEVPGGTFTSTKGEWLPNDTVDSVWDAALGRTIKAMEQTGAAVTVLGDIGYPLEDNSVCMATHRSDVGACSTPRKQAVFDAHNAAEEATADKAGATYVPVVQLLCTRQACPAVNDDTVVYRDAYHVTRQYSELLARAVGTALGLVSDATGSGRQAGSGSTG